MSGCHGGAAFGRKTPLLLSRMGQTDGGRLRAEFQPAVDRLPCHGFGEYQESRRKNKIDESAATIQKFLETAIEKGELCPATPTEELARLMVFAEFGALLYFCMTDGKFDLLQWAVDYNGTMEDTLLAPYWKGSESPPAP